MLPNNSSAARRPAHNSRLCYRGDRGGYFAGAPIAIGMLHNPKQPRLAVNKCVAVAAILTLLG